MGNQKVGSSVMKKSIAIVGAGGHGKVCAEIAGLMGYQKIVFLDDDPRLAGKVYGSTEKLLELSDDFDIFVAIGDNATRKAFLEKIRAQKASVATLIHPDSTVSKSAVVGEGSFVMAGAVVNADAVIERGVIVNTCGSVDHDCHLKDYCHVAVGAHLSGTVTVGTETFIGAGSTVINNVTIGDHVIIGAGACVISSIDQSGTYVGVPARKIK